MSVTAMRGAVDLTDFTALTTDTSPAYRRRLAYWRSTFAAVMG
jgi:hypothetical protein